MSIIYDIDEDTGGVLIPLGGEKYKGLSTIVDPEDVPLVSQHRWAGFSPSGARDRKIVYAKGYVPGPKYPFLHRFLLGVTDSKIIVDHINHNGLDNRRCNLRIGSQRDNMLNRRPNRQATSRFKGVSSCKRTGRWLAFIGVNGKTKNLGTYQAEIEAAMAYDRAARVLFGPNAFLNFPEVSQ